MRTRRMTTSMERVFKKLPDGNIREMTLHYIHFLADDGSIASSKLDKTIPGRLYRKATGSERSAYGEVEYQFPDEEHPCRLICLSMDYGDHRYGRF